MPRINRTTVEFPVDNHTFVAEFSHRHASSECRHIDKHGQKIHVNRRCPHFDGKGRPKHDVWTCPMLEAQMVCPEPTIVGLDYDITVGGKQKTIKVLHITTCRLKYKGQPSNISVTGTAPCSLLDTYNWRKGIIYSLQRACEKARYCKLEKGPDGRIKVVEKTEMYGKVMQSFFTELGKRPDEPTGGTGEGGEGAITGLVVVPAIPAIGPPPMVMNWQRGGHDYQGPMHGMGFTGD